MRYKQLAAVSAGMILLTLLSTPVFSTNAPITTCATITACSNTYVTVPVTVTNFTSITGATLWILYDTTVLRYDDPTTSMNAALVATTFYGVTQVSGSIYRFTISYANVPPGITLANGSILATIGFYHKTGTSTLSFDNTSNSGHNCEYATGLGVALTDVPTANFYFDGAVNSGENGGSVSGGSTITYGSSTGTLTLTGYIGTVQNWQRQYAGGGFTDIAGTSGQTSYSEIPSCTGVYDYRAVVKYGTCATQYSTPATVTVVMSPGSPKVWAGTTSNDFIDPGNWTPCGVPQFVEDIDIPAAVSNFPTVKNNGYGCKNVLVESGATLTVNSGIKLTVNGTFTLQP